MSRALARRYAKALLDVAGNDTDKAAQDLWRFCGTLSDSPELNEILYNPQLKQERTAVLDAVLKKLGTSAPVARLIRLLSGKNRIAILADLAQETETLADAKAGRLRAVVTSAMAPSDAQLKRIAQALEKRLQHPVVVSVRVDPSLLGGLVCQIGDLTFDSSLKSQLAILTERLGAQAH